MHQTLCTMLKIKLLFQSYAADLNDNFISNNTVASSFPDITKLFPVAPCDIIVLEISFE